MVGGSLYKPRTTDIEGKPLVYRHGPNINQPKVDYFVGLAVPKGAEKTWYETSWGQLILQVGAACFPAAYQSPQFAWKVEDGDSQVPNGKGHKPCDREGYAGHWILKTGGGYAPKTYTINATGGLDQIMTPDAIKPGYYVQAVITVDGNGSDLKPGIKLYNSTFCLRAVHHEITWGPDVSEAGFGAAPLPAGVSTVPPAMAVPMPAGAPGLPAVPMLPSVPVVPSPSITAPVSPIPNVPVIPNPSFLTGAVPAVPMAVPVPPVPSRTMTTKANGASYEALIANGWTEALLIANGLMV
jgi:hypothetical protein